MRRIIVEEWTAEARTQSPDGPEGVAVKCPACGHLQSVESVLAHNPELVADEVRVWIHQECEGRNTKGIGCDWALYGLLQIHELEVDAGKGHICRSFELASIEEAAALRQSISSKAANV